MENNKVKWQDKKDSLSSAIQTIAYPFDSLDDKINVVMLKWNNDKTPLNENKKQAFKDWFKPYFENPSIFNHYGLTIEFPWSQK